MQPGLPRRLGLRLHKKLQRLHYVTQNVKADTRGAFLHANEQPELSCKSPSHGTWRRPRPLSCNRKSPLAHSTPVLEEPVLHLRQARPSCRGPGPQLYPRKLLHPAIIPHILVLLTGSGLGTSSCTSAHAPSLGSICKSCSSGRTSLHRTNRRSTPIRIALSCSLRLNKASTACLGIRLAAGNPLGLGTPQQHCFVSKLSPLFCRRCCGPRTGIAWPGWVRLRTLAACPRFGSPPPTASVEL